MSNKSTSIVATMGIDIGKNSFRRPRSAWRDRAAAEVVAQPDRGTAGQLAAVLDRHGGLRRRASPEPKAAIAGSRRTTDAGEVRAPV